MNKEQRAKLESLTGYKTLKAAKDDKRYIPTFIIKGNAKLKDYNPAKDGLSDNSIYKYHYNGKAFKYAQFNLPALKTCPFATDGCKKFCYAKRDERWPDVRANRENNLDVSLSDSFIDRMIYTINVNLLSDKYYNSIMVVRIHESGEFYNRKYLSAWIKVFNYFKDSNVIFQFYTKSFDYFLALDDSDKAVIIDGLSAHKIGGSWSTDDTMSGENKLKALKLMSIFKGSNIYAAVNAVNPAHDKCDCKHCAKCCKCILTDGKETDVGIH